MTSQRFLSKQNGLRILPYACRGMRTPYLYALSRVLAWVQAYLQCWGLQVCPRVQRQGRSWVYSLTGGCRWNFILSDLFLMVKTLTLQSISSIKYTTLVGERTKLPSLPKSFAGMHPKSPSDWSWEQSPLEMGLVVKSELWEQWLGTARSLGPSEGVELPKGNKVTGLTDTKEERTHEVEVLGDLVRDWPGTSLSLPPPRLCPIWAHRSCSQAIPLSGKGRYSRWNRLCICACNPCKCQHIHW